MMATCHQVASAAHTSAWVQGIQGNRGCIEKQLLRKTPNANIQEM